MKPKVGNDSGLARVAGHLSSVVVIAHSHFRLDGTTVQNLCGFRQFHIPQIVPLDLAAAYKCIRFAMRSTQSLPWANGNLALERRTACRGWVPFRAPKLPGWSVLDQYHLHQCLFTNPSLIASYQQVKRPIYSRSNT